MTVKAKRYNCDIFKKHFGQCGSVFLFSKIFISSSSITKYSVNTSPLCNKLPHLCPINYPNFSVHQPVRQIFWMLWARQHTRLLWSTVLGCAPGCYRQQFWGCATGCNWQWSQDGHHAAMGNGFELHTSLLWTMVPGSAPAALGNGPRKHTRLLWATVPGCTSCCNGQ